MNSLKNYLKKEGIGAVVKRALTKVFHAKDSCTIFLRTCPGALKPEKDENGTIELLTEANRAAFEVIKFWDFIQADDFINNLHQSVVMYRIRDEYIAYAAEEHESDRQIHGLGSFLLRDKEAWIGPVYVCRNWRGQGYNRRLLLYQMSRLNEMGVTTVYTAINSQNASSLRSFKNAGFTEIGTVNNSGEIVDDPERILARAFHKSPCK